MPVYTYRCENCGHQFDRHQSFDDKPAIVCPNCGKHTLHKVYQPAGVVFKGSGFYVNDRKAKTSSVVPKNGKKPKEDKPAESKTENKPETKSEKSKPKAKGEE